MCKYFDFIVIDLQHSTISLNEAEQLIRIIDLAGKKPYVRIGSINPVTIGKMLDCGTKGIIIPDQYRLEWATPVEQLLPIHDSSYYVPKGHRSIGLYRCNEYGDKFKELYELSQKECHIEIIIQLEKTSTLNNLENILKKRWVTGTMIGTFDISACMGVTWELSNPIINNKVKQYIKTCNKHGKPAGIHLISSSYDVLKNYLADGYKFIAFGFDMMFINDKIKEALNYGKTNIQNRHKS